MRPLRVVSRRARPSIFFVLGVLALGSWTSAATAQEIFCRNLGIYCRLVPYGQGFGAKLTRNPLPKSPGALLALETNDMIVALDGAAITKSGDLETHFAKTDVAFINVQTNQQETRTVYVPNWVALDRLARSTAEDIRLGRMKYEKPIMETEGKTLVWTFDFVVDVAYFIDWTVEDAIPGIPPENRPVRAEYILQALRMTRTRGSESAFWEPYFNRVNRVIAEELAFLPFAPKDNLDAFIEYDRRIQEIYAEAMQRHAATLGLKAEYSMRVEGRRPFEVVLSTSKSPWIGLLPATRYLLADALKGAGSPNLEWKPYKSGATVLMLGTYKYVYLNRSGGNPVTQPADLIVENDKQRVRNLDESEPVFIDGRRP